MFFAYHRSRKSHFLLFGYGCLTLLAVSVIHLYRHSKEIHHTQQKNRNVATQIITKHTSQKDLTYYFCSHFYPTICQLKKDTSDPTGSVRKNIKGEILALQTYQEILRENSNLSVDEYDELFVKKVYTSKRRHRIQSAFHYVQNALLRYIDKQNNHIFTDREKKFLKNRLKKIKLELPPPASLYQDEPDLFTKNNILYERLTDNSLRLRVGGAYLITVQSWFNLIFSMSHELAHSIDPCELKFLQIYIPSYDKLSACFIKQGLVQIHNERSECGENDELSETFADWIAVQI
ncbi:MAG: hypothetical protein HY843_05925, partial [Bdellovibrio sp.]|nr:hypothetical protein [Bdellovibrio sp.]